MTSFQIQRLAAIALIVLAASMGKAAAFAGVARTNLNRQVRVSATANDAMDVSRQKELHQRRREEWINNSIEYYSKVMREERRRSLGQWAESYDSEEFTTLAKKHYFARYKIKNGERRQAEVIYKKIIDDIIQDKEGGCDHAQLAVTTLLLALLLQQMGDYHGTRVVFGDFFRLVVASSDESTECACSAKVMQAYALFEMKRGNPRKSLAMAKRAIQFDSSLAPLLKWKKFQDILSKTKSASVAA